MLVYITLKKIKYSSILRIHSVLLVKCSWLQQWRLKLHNGFSFKDHVLVWAIFQVSNMTFCTSNLRFGLWTPIEICVIVFDTF